MGIMASGTFNQALLFFDEKNSREQGPALWAALHEVERFYSLAQPSLNFRRFYFSPEITTLGTIESAWRGIGRLLTRQTFEYTPDLPSGGERIEKRIPAATVGGHSSKSYDQSKIAGEVRRLLSLEPQDGNLLIVTDRPITPPQKWRYIIWDIVPEGAVISTVPLDPAYWRDSEPNRIGYIKYRVRCSALAVTGLLLGIDGCYNPRCFMFEDVDSFAVLDTMTEFGPEHKIDALSGMGFQAIVTDPDVVQAPLSSKAGRGRSLL
jgi:hypothetical protein